MYLFTCVLVYQPAFPLGETDVLLFKETKKDPNPFVLRH